jgi:hypothetical protein
VKNNEAGYSGSLRSQLDNFCGRPALLKGEDRNSYSKLRKTVSELMHPQNLLDAIEVQEVVDSIWEARRFQKLGTKLVDAERQKAFNYLANSMFGYVSEAAGEWIESIADKPYPDEMTEADVLKKVGLSEELVQAKAVLLAADNFAVLEKLVANRIAQRKASLKDYERRKRLDAKEKRLAAKAKLQHRDLANDNRPAEREIRQRTKPSS